MKNSRYIPYVLFFLMLYVAACSRSKNSNKQSQSTDSTAAASAKEDVLVGNLQVSVDQSVLPLVKEQEEVFLSAYPNAKINIIAKPEVLAIQELLADRAKIAVLTRTLNESESAYFDQRSIRPRVFPVAVDAIVLVGHTKSADTSVTMSYVFDTMAGKTKQSKKLVFDNINSSSFRQLKAMAKLEKVSATNVETKESAKEVLEEVAGDEAKIGVLSYSDYLNLKPNFSDLNNIRTLSVQNSIGEGADDKYYKPNQSTIAAEQYPLRRTVYILNYQPKMGLGIGFSAFMTGDRGQRIVLKSGLVPAKMPGREIIIRDNI